MSGSCASVSTSASCSLSESSSKVPPETLDALHFRFSGLYQFFQHCRLSGFSVHKDGVILQNIPLAFQLPDSGSK